MTILAATPYLILNGRADEAISFYQEALGASVPVLTRFGDNDANCPEALRQNVMHAVLKVGDATIMMSDGDSKPLPPTVGAVSVALGLDDSTEARKSFELLSQGGTVVSPLFAAPWGALFGVVTDRYGVNWMFNCEVKLS